MSREGRTYAIVGSSRCGKTTLCIESIIKWKNANNGLVFGHDLKDNYDNKLLNYKITDNNNIVLLSKLSNILVILDEFRSLYGSDRVNDVYRTFFSVNREYCIDVILVFHSLDFVNNFLFSYVTDWIIFESEFNPNRNKSKSIDYKLIKSINEINEEVLNNGKGEFPNFKYIHYAADKGIINKVNY